MVMADPLDVPAEAVAEATGRPAQCPACGGRGLDRVESVAADRVADAWYRQHCHGPGVTVEALRSFVARDVGSPAVEFWRCDRCGLEVAFPMRSWSAEHYPQDAHSLGFDHSVALEHLAGLRSARVLDIGCADGQFLARGAALGHHMVGIDFARDDVDAARARGLEAYVADVGEIADRFADGQKFSVVTLFQVIEHLSTPGEVFAAINRVIEPGALLFVGCPSDRRYSRVYQHPARIGRSDFWDYPPQHTLRWTEAALRAFLPGFGWTVEDVVYEPFTVVGAAAHMTAEHGLVQGWYGRRWRRRAETARWMVRTAWTRMRGSRLTGTRMFVAARRAAGGA
jgi:SAM-dependent methyltransferase